MNLLVFNLAVDEKHVTLAFALRWLERLASLFDHIDVITMTKGDYKLPANVKVWSVGRERGYPEWFRLVRFYWLVCRVLIKRRIDVVFTHMIPIFAILFWPVARLVGLKNVLWYAHGATPTALRLAHLLVDQVITSTPEGFRLESSKVVYIGQGVEILSCNNISTKEKNTFDIVTVGRLAQSKHLELILDALAEWETSIEWRLLVVGDATSDKERAYAEMIRERAFTEFGAEKVQFTGRLTAQEISSLLSQANVFVNMSSTGSLDKALVEAMGHGCPVISCNNAFRQIALMNGFQECAIDSSAGALRRGIEMISNLSTEKRVQLTRLQASVAQRDHSLDGFITRLYGVLSA